MSKVKMQVPPSDLYLSIRGIQYAFHEALADLADNSIDAEATRVWIKAEKGEVIVADDGNGMSRDDLEVAITPWRAGKKNERLRRGKRGKFGIGMKSASYSLGDCLEIHTKAAKSDFEYIELDKDKISKIDSLDHVFITENKQTNIFKSFCKDGVGTVLRITKVNKRKVTDQAIESLRNLLGLVYFQLIENGELKIIINNQEVKPLDPLMRGLKKNKSHNRYYAFDKSSINIDYEGKRSTFKLHAAYVGRPEYWTEEDKKNYKYFLKRGDSAQLKLDEQGIYTLRNGRLITLGGWLGIASVNTVLHHNTPTRVILEFDETGDELMGLDNTKTQLKIEELLKDKIGSYVRSIINEGSKFFRRDGEELKKKELREKSSKNIKDLTLRKDSALSQYQMEERRKKNIPEYDAKQKKIDKEQEDEATGSQDLVILKEALPYGNLWDIKKNKDGEVLLLMNEQHPGYSALFLEDEEDKLRKNLNHFFYALALHEASISELYSDLKPSTREELEKAFKTFRRWVSKHYTEF